MCGSVLATWEALLRQNLAGAVPARLSTANPSHALPYTSKALGYDHSFHLSIFVPLLLHVSERKLKHRLQHLRSPTVECLLATRSGVDFSTWSLQGPGSSSPRRRAAYHGSSPIYLYLSMSMLLSRPFFMQSWCWNSTSGVCRVSATGYSAMAPISLPSAH